MVKGSRSELKSERQHLLVIVSRAIVKIRLTYIFIEHVSHHLTHADIVISPMLQKEHGEESELRDSEVRSINSLEALLPPDPNTHMCFLYHRYIVCPVPDREGTHSRYTYEE